MSIARKILTFIASIAVSYAIKSLKGVEKDSPLDMIT
jgi:hypothetical protein